MRNGEYEYYDDSMGWPAFFVGALLGGAVALLLAPRTGSRLRGILHNYASRLKDEALEQGRTARDAAVERGKGKRQGAMQEMGRSPREVEPAGKEALRKAS